MTFKFEIREQKTDEGVKFVGAVLDGDDYILMTSPQKTEKRAIRQIRTMWNTAVYCGHSYEIHDEYSDHNQYGGTDDVLILKCKRCGLIMKNIQG